MTAPSTKTDEFLMNCPACKKHINAELTYSVKLNERARAEGQAVDLIDATATATLKLTGLRIQHECPTPKPISFFIEGGNPLARGDIVTTHNPVIRED